MNKLGLLLFLILLSCEPSSEEIDFKTVYNSISKARNESLSSQEIIYLEKVLNESIDDTTRFDLCRALGMSSVHTKAYAEAKYYFYKASEIELATDRPLADLGYIFLLQDSIQKGISYLDSAININPDNLTAREHRFNYYLNTKKYDQALIDVLYFYKGINTSQNEEFITLTLSNLGYCYMMIGEYQKSKTFLEKAINFNDKCSFCKVNLAELNLKQGNPKVAIDILNSIYESRESPSSYAQYVRLMCLEKLNKRDEYCSIISLELLEDLKKEFDIEYSDELNCQQ